MRGAVLASALGCSSPKDEDPGSCQEFSRTEFAGDCLALTKPSADEALYIHYGPKSYSKADMEPFILKPGEERVDIQYTVSDNDEPIWFNRYQQRMRPGAHHLIVSHGEGDYEGVVEQDLPPLTMETLLGAQAGSIDVPTPGLPIAPEDEGLAFTMGARRQLALNAHFINTTNKPILREAWFNLWYIDPAKVTMPAGPMFLIGGTTMAVKPHTTAVLKNTAVVDHDLRIVWAFGHFHTHTTRLTAYKVSGTTGERTLIYETYDYLDPLYVGYNTLVHTPLPDREAKISGAYTGMLELKQGDSVDWECEVVNNDEFVINFANQLLTAEMCGFFGFYAPAPEGRTWRVIY